MGMLTPTHEMRVSFGKLTGEQLSKLYEIADGSFVKRWEDGDESPSEVYDAGLKLAVLAAGRPVYAFDCDEHEGDCGDAEGTVICFIGEPAAVVGRIEQFIWDNPTAPKESVEGFHTGPTIVGKIAQKCREAGIIVEYEGTERVYVQVPPEHALRARTWVLDTLRQKHGTDFGLK